MTIPINPLYEYTRTGSGRFSLKVYFNSQNSKKLTSNVNMLLRNMLSVIPVYSDTAVGRTAL